MTQSFQSAPGTHPVMSRSEVKRTFRHLLLTLLVAAGVAPGLLAQTRQTVFIETLGTDGTSNNYSITAYATNTSPTYDNKGVLTFSNGGIGNNSNEIRGTSGSSASNGIASASGQGNVYFTATGPVGFSIENIKAANFSSLQLSYIWRKESGGATSMPSLSVDYSLDGGTNWTSLVSGNSAPFVVSSPLTQASSASSTGWYGAATLSLPVGAQIDGLKIRFVKSGSIAIRIDDIRLTGIPASPTLDPLTTTTVNRSTTPYTLSVTGSNFNRSMPDRVNNSSVGAPSNITVGGVAQTTTYTSATALSANIDISTPGTYAIGVTTTGAAATSATRTLTVLGTPVVTTNAATLTDGSSSVTLNGTVNANTLSTTNGFQYGTTNAYGSTIASNEGTLSGGSATPITATLSGLSPNTTYYFTATASNSDGTVDGSGLTFVSPASVPSAPTVGNPSTTTLDVTLNSDANPAGTEYAIFETTTGQYVQAGGALGASAAWATMASWGTKTVTGLNSNTAYTFQAIARNSSGTLTAGSATASGSTLNGNSIAVNGASFAASYCNGSSNTFNVSFSSGGTFNGNFLVQMSDASGVFPNNTTDNIIGSNTASPISATIPAGYSVGSGYRFRVISDNPVFYGSDNGSDVAITAAITPSVSIGANPGTTICSGTSVTFTATPVNGGTPSYQWTKNGSNVGSNSNTYTDAALANGDVVAVTMTSSLTCLTTNGVTDQLTMTVNTTPAPPTPTVANGCGNASLNALADPGAPLAYYWQGTSSSGVLTSSPATSAYPVSVTGTYYVRAYNSSTGCWSASSPSVTVTSSNIITAPAITLQPLSTSGYVGGGATFISSATNATVSSRTWQVSTDGGNNWNAVNLTTPYSSTLSGTASYLAISSLTAAMSGNQYRLLYGGNAPCANVASNAVTLSPVSPAQALVFLETAGSTASSTGTALTAYTGYTNGVGLAFSSTTSTKTDVRTSQNSLGYANVSGGSGFYMGTASIVQRDLIISNINTSNIVNPVLSFGMYRSNTSTSLVIEVSTDGTNWSPLTFSFPAATSVWTPVTVSGTIPSSSTLRIRFTKDGNGDIRFDDIRLAGYYADPTTTSLSPSSAYAGDGTFTLTVNGSNFQNGASVITWNGTPLTTTYVSSSKLTASVTASLVANAGTATVGVTTTGAVNSSNTQVFTINPRSITLNSISGNNFCNGSANSLSVGYTSQGAYSGSFYVQLSDASGNFPANATDNIISSASLVSPIVATIPQGQAAGTYKVRVVNTNPFVVSSASGNITIDQSGSASIAYTGSPYCTNSGTGTVFFSGTNGGTFTATPAGLVINASTGDIDIAASQAGTYTVTYSFNGGTACASSATTQVSIRPASLMNAVANQSFCANSTTTPINFSGPAGITYNWANTNTAIGLPSSGTGNIPSFTATNSGNSTDEAIISVLPVGGTGCSAKISAFHIFVKPVPVINGVGNQVVCAGAPTTAVNFSSSVATATYVWTNTNPAIGLVASGGGNIPSFTAQNSTGTPTITATVQVTPLAGGCAGVPTSFTYTVNRGATSIAYSGSPYCPNGSVTPVVNGTTGGTFSSTAGLVINASTGIITLSQSQPGTYTVTYTTANTAGGCGNTATAQITIKPLATVNAIGNQVYCNGMVTAPINFTGTATSYSWVNDNPAIGLAASGTGTQLPSFTTVNAGPSVAYAYVKVTPLSTAGLCPGKPIAFRYTINYCGPIAQSGGTGATDGNARISSQLTLSPNPARGQVTVQYTGGQSGPFTVQLVDAFGQPATRVQSFNGTTTTIDLSAVRPGVYLLQWVNTRTGATAQSQVIKL